MNSIHIGWKFTWIHIVWEIEHLIGFQRFNKNIKYEHGHTRDRYGIIGRNNIDIGKGWEAMAEIRGCPISIGKDLCSSYQDCFAKANLSHEREPNKSNRDEKWTCFTNIYDASFVIECRLANFLA